MSVVEDKAIYLFDQAMFYLSYPVWIFRNIYIKAINLIKLYKMVGNMATKVMYITTGWQVGWLKYNAFDIRPQNK